MKKEEKQAIVFFVENSFVDNIRSKYDKRPIKPHLTLVYPFTTKKNKISRIKKFIKNQESFDVIFGGFSKSKKEYYLYFDILKNKRKILGLHKRLYKILGMSFNNPDMPKYIPHISLGIFNSEREINKAKQKLESENHLVNHHLDKISVLTLGNGWQPKSILNIYLKQTNYDKSLNSIAEIISRGYQAYWNLPHAREVLNQLLIIHPNAKDYLKIAGLGHDIERSITGETDSKLKTFGGYDNYKEKHAIRSAKIISDILIKSNFPKKEIKKYV